MSICNVGMALAHLRYLLNDARPSETLIPMLKFDGQTLLDHIAALEAENERLRAQLAAADAEREKAERFAQLFAVFRTDRDTYERVRGMPSFDAVEDAYREYRVTYRAARKENE